MLMKGTRIDYEELSIATSRNFSISTPKIATRNQLLTDFALLNLLAEHLLRPTLTDPQ